ncbi:MAG: hypothetical protein LBD87_03030 [Prevotellaceae bacterium]|jgi:hypothetical protein|nr:hypothetical protein [Prevotellaceae bacterium]
MANDYIPAKEKDFHDWQHHSLEYVQTNKTRFGISDSALESVLTKQADYESKYAVSENPETRTSASILARKEAREGYGRALRQLFKGSIIYNLAVTDEDRRIMGVKIHDTKPTPVPPPTSEPEVTFSIPSPAVIEIHFRDKDESGRAKPHGIHGAETAWGVLDDKPADWAELPHSSFATHSPLRLTFNGHDRGKKFYFALRWENTRGEKGPWTEILDTVVP